VENRRHTKKSRDNSIIDISPVTVFGSADMISLETIERDKVPKEFRNTKGHGNARVNPCFALL
jgi:hypothetical protein